MKKLLLLLLLSLSYVASAEVTYSSGIGVWYGDDGSECDETISGLICENYNGTVVTSYDKSGSTWYGDDGSECEMDLLDLICKSYYELNEYQIKAGERGRKTGEMLGKAFNEIFDNSPMSGTPLFNFGTRIEFLGSDMFSSDGLQCWNSSGNIMSCNNGIDYSPCGGKLCGTDGTSYLSNKGNGGTDTYNCVTSSFGSICCGDSNNKTCR